MPLALNVDSGTLQYAPESTTGHIKPVALVLFHPLKLSHRLGHILGYSPFSGHKKALKTSPRHKQPAPYVTA